MRRRTIFAGIAAAAGMLVLILDSKTALSGAAQGLELCLRTVIPSLFPFILLSNLMTDAFSGTNLPLLRPLTKFFSMPKGTESLLVPAFLGGYPVGAQCIGLAYQSGQLSKGQAEKLLAFCSNAGPSFLFGMVGAMFPKLWMAWALWGIQLISAWLVSTLIPRKGDAAEIQGITKKNSSAMGTSVSVMGSICGWVVIFRVLIAFLERWFLWLFPVQAKVAVMGILELSNGCCSLSAVESIPVRFVLASSMLSFGGICVVMQTASVIPGLSIKYYLLGKILQTLFSTILSLSLFFCPLYAAMIPFFLMIPRKLRKNSSNPLPVGV